MTIRSLVDCLDDLPTLARLHHEEWSRVSPFKTLEQHAIKLRLRISRDPIPSTYVLFIEGIVAGSVSLVLRDDIAQLRPDLSPWLSSLFVVRSRRGRGFGRELVAYCARAAAGLGFAHLYLHTETHEHFYERLGWETIEMSDGPVDGALMKLSLRLS